MKNFFFKLFGIETEEQRRDRLQAQMNAWIKERKAEALIKEREKNIFDWKDDRYIQDR